MKKLLIVVLIAAFLAGCSSSKKQEDIISGDEYKARGTWSLYSMGGVNVDSTGFTNGLPWMSLYVDALHFEGNTGCNTMSGALTVMQGKISFSRIITTRMACDKGDEAGFLAALNSADSYSISNDMLTLKAGSKPLAVFKKTGDVIKNEGGLKKPGDR